MTQILPLYVLDQTPNYEISSEDELLKERASYPGVKAGGRHNGGPDLPVEPAWMREGACTGEGAEALWRTLENATKEAVAKAKAVCNGCPVREECLQFELRMEQSPGGKPVPASFRHGVWGGKTPRERYEIAMNVNEKGLAR